MFPITKAALSFGEIADYWSREIRPPASSTELLSLLVAAWWLGELRGNSRHSRLQLLKLMFRSTYKDDLGFVFVVGDAEGPPDVELPNGSLKVHLYKIHVPPTNTDNWNEAACKEAFQELAQITKESLFKQYREFAIFLPSIELTFEDFDAWRKKRGYEQPKFFWRPQLKSSKRGRPAEYNWPGVKTKLEAYVSKNGPVKTLGELIQKSADFAHELHPCKNTPNDATTRSAIKTYGLAAAARFDPGK
jgi:hypothetical protein